MASIWVLKVFKSRAMVLRPEIILADEPTGNLDPQSAWEVMQLLTKVNGLGSTVIMATHNLDITSSLPHRRIEIEKGNYVREDEDIEVYHWEDGTYHTEEVQGFDGDELETYDYDTGEFHYYEMD
mgnify:CR=1 FL=1